MASNLHRKSGNERFSTENYLFGTAPNVFPSRLQSQLQSGQHALAVTDGEGATASG